ncbi:MAG: N-6 DNA methylase, partial [Candidatus Thorarchaeota archaeon]
MTLNEVKFERVLDFIEKLLIERDILQTNSYKAWYNYYINIYGKKRTNINLYVAHSLIYFFSRIFIAKYILNRELLSKSNIISANIIIEIISDLKPRYSIELSPEINYFLPFFDVLKVLTAENTEMMINLSLNAMKSFDHTPEYFFDYIVQVLLTDYIRHSSGEFYTPPFIVMKMVKEAYTFGDKVLDPCCGSGNFLIEIVKRILNASKSNSEKIKALKAVYGYDINPISVYLTKVNMLYLLKESFININQNLRVSDFLFQSEKNANNDFDLIIGNPPWYTLRDVDSLEYQEKMKLLSDQLEIKPLPKNVLNIEVASLFFYKAKVTHMKINAKIFFVITRGVITGSHAARFRNFKGFSNVYIWKFTPEITEIFNIDFICIYAQKSANR